MIFLAPTLSSAQDDKEEQKDQINNLIIESDSNYLSNRSLSDSLMIVAWEIINRENITDSKTIASAYHQEGRILMRNGRFIESIDAFKESYRIKKISFPDSLKSISKTINGIGVCFLNLHKYDSANFYCEMAKKPLLDEDIWDINLYYAYLNIGINNAIVNKYSIALAYFDSAFTTLEKGDLLEDSLVLGRYYHNRAFFTTVTGKLEEANKLYRKTEEIYSNLEGDYSESIFNININKSVNSFYNYDFAKAELYLKKALEVYSKNPEMGTSGLARIYLNLANIYQMEGNNIRAIEHCFIGLDNDPNNDMRLLLTNNLASSYAAIDDNENAIKYYLKSLELLNNDNINPKRERDIYSSVGDFMFNKANLSNSLYYYQKASRAAINLQGVSSIENAEILVKIGDFFLKSKVKDSALLYFTNAQSIFESDSLSSESDNLHIIRRKQAKIGIGSALYLEYQQTGNTELLQSADSIFSEVLAEMEIISSKLSTANKLLLLEIINPVYLQAIEISFEIYKNANDIKYLEKVANYIERSKSAALLAEVNSENAIKTSDIPIETFEYENQTKAEINGISQMLGKEKIKENPNIERIVFFETKLLELLNRYDSLITDIETRYPKYHSVKYYQGVISLSEIQSKIEQDESILEYIIADSTLYSVGISKTDFSIASVPIDSNFFKALKYLISIKNVNLNQQNIQRFNEFKESSFLLWKALIEPHLEIIGNNRLIIIPDGLLGYLSFDILMEYNYETDKINYRDLPFLIRNHPISYSYSSTLRYNTFFDKIENKNSRNILAFAPSYNSTKSNEDQLDDLPYSKSEVTAIVYNHGGKAFVDEAATKENFIHESGSTEILHLAMHAIINDSLPFQSKLVFSDNNSDTISNYMFTHEIYNLDIDASMVTLSACNTGSGKFSKGEGIMSLARGFVYAGVPSVIMTLWEVQDATGSKLMDNYYTYLFEGMKKDKALQYAKLDILKEANMANAHPFFWSAYVVNGDTSEVFVAEKNNHVYWLIAFFLIVIIIAGLIYLRHRHINAKASIKNS